MLQRPWQSTQTPLLLTDASWQQENFALVFHVHKMPAGLALQELRTSVVSWESSGRLRTFFPSLRQNFKSLKKEGGKEKQISMCLAHRNFSSDSDPHLLGAQTAPMMQSIW